MFGCSVQLQELNSLFVHFSIAEEERMDDLDQLLGKVPYRYRSQVRRDVIDVLVGSDEEAWLPWSVCLASGEETPLQSR